MSANPFEDFALPRRQDRSHYDTVWKCGTVIIKGISGSSNHHAARAQRPAPQRNINNASGTESYRLLTLRAVRPHVAGLLLRSCERRPRGRIDMPGDAALLGRRHSIVRLTALLRDNGRRRATR